MKVLKENAQNSDKMREAGMTLQLFKTLIKTKAWKTSELFKTMNGEEDGERSAENRLMGFGEYPPLDVWQGIDGETKLCDIRLHRERQK